MKRNYLIGFAVAAAVLALLIFTARSLFEISPVTREVLPSREARINEYLALDRWLLSSGIPVRIKSSGNLSTIMEAKERQIFIQTSLFHWTDDAARYLVNWVEEGGILYLVLEMNFYFTQSAGTSYVEEDLYDEALLYLLKEFGITTGAAAGFQERPLDLEVPSFGGIIFFEVPGNSEALTLKDSDDLIRLVEVERGKGKLMVSGQPGFLLSANLGDAPNARLAWALFGTENGSGEAPDTGCLFIRDTVKIHGFFGSLLRQGNLAVLLVSVLVLLAVGFWTVLPMFGLVRENDERPGKLLRERFLAEGRFFKRYEALDFYRQVYVKEIKRRLAGKEGLVTDDEIENRVMDILISADRERDSSFFSGMLSGKPFTYREFPKMITIFETILERI